MGNQARYSAIQTKIQRVIRNIHALLGAKMPQKALGYCVVFAEKLTADA
jgi:hypothetical protein